MSERKSNKNALSMIAVICFGLLACLLYGIGAGIRSDIGILLEPLARQCHVSYENASLCIAVMQIIFGAAQPVFGMVASRKSNRFVLLSGVALIGLSFIGLMLARSFAGLFLALSVLFGLGAGAIAFGLVLTSAIYFVGKQHAMIISGMLNAAAGMCGFVLSPSMQALIARGGVPLTMRVLLIPMVILIPVAIFITSKDPKKTAKQEDAAVSGKDIAAAFHHRVFLLLLAGFSTCGFHMVIIESHLFSQFVSYGIVRQSASWAFSIYGLATIIGALLSGFLSTRVKKGHLLTFYYGFRAVWTAIYLFLLPKNMVTAVIFAIGLGMTGDATVSPTSGLVSDHFDIAQVATLVGILFLGHQAGAFLSAWLGGILLKWTGGYTALWCLDMALCVFASVMSFRIEGQKKKQK